MKLWQKVFLISLAGIMLATELAGFLVLSANFKGTLEREIAQAVSQYNYVTAGISNNIVYRRLQTGKLLLSKEEVIKTVKKLTETQLDHTVNVAVYDGDTLVSKQTFNTLADLDVFTQKVKSTDGVFSYICDEEEETYILVGAKVNLENEPYLMYTATNVTGIYAGYTAELRYTILVSILVSFAIALILLVVVYRLLLPLRRTNRMLRQIASGQYALRLPEQGTHEFKELASNINVMAKAIGENVESLENIAESRKQFVDNFAHEMKTPLTSMLGFADILRVKRSVSDKERQEYAGIIVEEAKRLKNLSGKLLEIAMTDHAQLDFECVSIEELLGEIALAVLPLLQRKHIRLICTPIDKSLVVDRVLFTSLLYNLIDNAVKASNEESEIDLYAQETENTVRLCVQDHGIGLSSEQIRQITQPFYMVDKSRSRKEGGTGLGLSLCLEIAKRHNATLSIQSAIGQGTAVTVTMPRGGNVHENT